MSEIKSRPVSIINFEKLGLGQILRLEQYRTLNPWWKRLVKGKYQIHLLALTKDSMYDICQPHTSECNEILQAKAPQQSGKE